MDNKLSKPVAYDYQIAGACIADGHNENGKWVDWNNKFSRYCPPDWMVEEGKVTELKPLYSQEYVSALKQRIAELEAKLATPVRLPRRAPENLASVLDGYEKWLIATTFRDTWNACLDEVSRVSSGFTVEGDE